MAKEAIWFVILFASLLEDLTHIENVYTGVDYICLIFERLNINESRNINEANNDIDGPVGRSRWYEKSNPVTEEIIPKKILTFIDSVNVLVISFAEAAGIISMLKTRIIPTVWSELTTLKDKTIKNK